MLNRVCLIGRLTKEPELRYSPKGIAVSNFILAVDRSFKNAQGEREADFIPCVAYRQLAELVANYLDKGRLASVEGRIQVRTYNTQSGEKRWVTEIIADNVFFLDKKKDNDSGNSQNNQSSGTSSFGHEVNLDDDIPF